MRARLAISTLLLATAASCWLDQRAAAGEFHFITSRVELVRDKLEEVATSRGIAQLTADQLKEAYQQSQKWGYQVGQQIKASDKSIDLVADLLVAMHDHLDEASCVERLGAYYSLYRDQIPQANEFSESQGIAPKTVQLVASLLELEGHEQLTKQLLDDAHNEYNQLVNKFNSIELNELAQNEAELESILTFVNLDQTRLLANKIFPKAPTTRTSDELDSLKWSFYFEMRNMAFIVESGRLVKLRMPTLDEIPIEIPF